MTPEEILRQSACLDCKRVNVPPFNIAPEVIIWGDRVFIPADDKGVDIYREAFSWAAPVGRCEVTK